MHNLSVKKSKNIHRSLEFRKNGNYAEVLFKYKNKGSCARTNFKNCDHEKGRNI